MFCAFARAVDNAVKAENLLMDSVNIYKADGWDLLADSTRMDLAECQRLTMQTHRFLTY